ncbi:MAG TPA: hypothetical protein DDY78_27130 [Planctomycetales bacterium]|jgi:hypothetical protein|nr:hypothetical protein [Planctomycetales bacterium]
MPLEELACDHKPERDADLLLSITTLTRINFKSAAQFWKETDAEAKPPVDDAWVKQVAKTVLR